MKYNYLDAIVEDIKEYLIENRPANELLNIDDLDEFKEDLYEELWDNDSVTGNGSGSYTFNREKAKQYVVDNFGDLIDACSEFGISYEELGAHMMEEDWEWADVTIRCSLLSEAIDRVVG